MRVVVTTRGPDHEDNATAPNCQALQPEFAVGLSPVFRREHLAVED